MLATVSAHSMVAQPAGWRRAWQRRGVYPDRPDTLDAASATLGISAPWRAPRWVWAAAWRGGKRVLPIAAGSSRVRPTARVSPNPPLRHDARPCVHDRRSDPSPRAAHDRGACAGIVEARVRFLESQSVQADAVAQELESMISSAVTTMSAAWEINRADPSRRL